MCTNFYISSLFIIQITVQDLQSLLVGYKGEFTNMQCNTLFGISCELREENELGLNDTIKKICSFFS